MEMEIEFACNESSLTNLTRELSCEPVGLLAFHGVCLAVLLAASLFGNFTALYLVWAYRELRQRSVLASLGLIVADVLMTSVWVLQAEASLIGNGWPFGEIGCAVWSYFYLALLYVRWCEIFVFTNDRFCQILFPFWYERWGNVLLVVSTTLAWLITAIISLPFPILGFFNFYLSLTACSVNCGDHGNCSTGVIAVFGFFISIGGVVPTVMYTALYIYGWKKKVAMKKMLKMGTGEGIPRNNSIYNNRQKLVQEIRLLTTCFLVFLTTILTNIPLYITSSLRSREEVYEQIPVWTHFVVTHIFLLGPVLDPIVIMRTKSFRKALAKTFLCRKGILILSSSGGTVSRGLRGVLDMGVVSSEAGEISKNNAPTPTTSSKEVTTNGTNIHLSLSEGATAL